jgi:hypothetical protein
MSQLIIAEEPTPQRLLKELPKNSRRTAKVEFSLTLKIENMTLVEKSVKILVVVFVATDCPIATGYQPTTLLVGGL